MLHNGTVTHAEISFGGHADKETVFDDSGNHVQRAFDFFPVQCAIKLPVQQKIAIVSHNRTLFHSNQMCEFVTIFLIESLNLDTYCFRASRHPQSNFPAQMFFDFPADSRVGTGNHFNRNTFMPLFSESFRSFSNVTISS